MAHPARPEPRRPDLAWLGAWLVPATLVPALLAGRALGDDDLGHFFIPGATVLRDALLEGRLPFWTDLWLCGLPYQGALHFQTWYPPRVLASLLLREPWATSALVVAHLAWASSGTIRLARRAGLTGLAAGLSGALVAGAPLFASLHVQLNLLSSAAWMPWAALAGLSLAGGRGGGALAVVSCAGAILGGSPDAALPVLAALVLAAASAPRGERGRALGLAAAAVAAAVALSAPALLPFLDLVGVSERAAGVGAEAGRWALTWRDVLALVLPHLPLDAAPVDLASLTSGPHQQYLRSVYAGASTVALAAAGLACLRPSRERSLAVAFAAGGLVVAAGLHVWMLTPLTAVAPWLLPTRYPVKLAWALLPPLAVAAAVGVTGLRERVGERAPRVRRAIAGGVAIGLGAALVALAAGRPGLGTSLLWATSAAGLSLLAALAGGRRGAVLAGAVALLDLGGAHLARPILRTHPAAQLVADPLPGIPVEGRLRPPPLDGLARAGGQAGGLVLTNRYASAGRPSVDFYGQPVIRAVAARVRSADGPRLAGASTVVSWEPCAAPLEQVGTVPGAHVCRDPRALPRAYLAGRVAARCDEPPPACVELAGAPEREEGSAQPPAPAPDASAAGSVRFLPSPGPERVELEVDARAATWVVLSDAYHRGWRAAVDGRDVPISRALGAFRAVPVEAGPHRVVFEYRPRWPGPAALAALGGLVAAAAVVVGARRRRPLSPAPGDGGAPRRPAGA